MRHRYTPLGEDQLDVTQAEAEEVIQPHRVPDDLGREAIAGVGGGLWRHPASFAQAIRSGQPSSTWQYPAGEYRIARTKAFPIWQQGTCAQVAL
ncbi:hypothetical protein ACFQX4_27485 [Roseomonas sp. GCM10028921]